MRFIHAYLPSPSHGVWHLGPVPIRAYALLILTGIWVAVWLGNKRWMQRGGLDGQVSDIALWAVPFGVIGGRLYHVLTDWSTYFGTGGRGFKASLMIWEGGLGIWGAISLGAVGAWIACRRNGVSLPPLADAVAPGIAFAQAIGRWGNYANQELFGKPTTLPWGLKISIDHRPTGYIQFETFHPTFLYESIACVVIGFVVIWADKKFHMGHGRAFALYLSLYCAARGLIETLRIDEAHHILGIRLNVFTALIVGLIALAYMVRSAEKNPGRELVYAGRVVTEDQLEELQTEARHAAVKVVVESDSGHEDPDSAHVGTDIDPVVVESALESSAEHFQPVSDLPEEVESVELDEQDDVEANGLDVGTVEPAGSNDETDLSVASATPSGRSRGRRAKPKKGLFQR